MEGTADFDDPSENPSFKCNVTDTWMRPQDAGWEARQHLLLLFIPILFQFTLHSPAKHQFLMVLALWIQEQAKLLK